MGNYAEFIIKKSIDAGGSWVTEKEKERRLKICSTCPEKGTVYPVPGERYEGCLQCGCILKVKAAADYYINFKRMKKEKSKCPLNKWEK